LPEPPIANLSLRQAGSHGLRASEASRPLVKGDERCQAAAFFLASLARIDSTSARGVAANSVLV
jgi:hypothetical protein